MTKTPSRKELREFSWIVGGILFFAFGLILPWQKGEPFPRYPLLAIGAGLALCGTFLPVALLPVFRAWMWIGHWLGRINTFILLHLVFYVIFTPVGLVLRFSFWKTAVLRRPDKEAGTYRSPSVARAKEQMKEIF